MCLALDKLRQNRSLQRPLLTGMLAAISVGIVEGRPVADLDYVEDSAAEVDMNVARTDRGAYVEVQGTAESAPFKRDQLDAMLDLADQGIERLHLEQREALGSSVFDPILK
jgi:ribonuclease PH